MHALQASDYFDLQQYEHRALFVEGAYVWEAIDQIAAYMQTYPFAHGNQPYAGVTFVKPESFAIGEGTLIEPGAHIEGPCIIGKRCQIRCGAYLRPNVIVGDECVIGHGSEVKNSILLDAVHMAHFNYGGDSIFGNRCNLGAGAVCANFKFDGSAVVVHVSGEHYVTKRRKLGAILGDGAQVGCNAVTNPGTLIGRNSLLYPCTNYGGVAPADSLIRREGAVVIAPKAANITHN
jgi:NDP-sugar pyrophosphorylase family protein